MTETRGPEKREAETKGPLVSVIVPVYNRGETVGRCLDSILSQTWRNLEIILINDGSTDNTWSVLQRYGQQDERIMLINKPNTGVSDSRNFGMESAHGEYIQFVDSDDWLPENATEEYVRGIRENGSDLVIADYYRIRGRRILQSGDIKEAGTFTRTEFAEKMMLNAGDFYYGVVWNKLFRRDLIEEHRLSFDQKLAWCEDFLFNLEYLRYAKTITVLKKPLYFYVKTKGSLVNTMTTPANVIRTKLTLFEYYKDLYQSLDLYEKNRLKIQLFLIQAATDKKRPVDRETYGMVSEKYLQGPDQKTKRKHEKKKTKKEKRASAVKKLKQKKKREGDV